MDADAFLRSVVKIDMLELSVAPLPSLHVQYEMKRGVASMLQTGGATEYLLQWGDQELQFEQSDRDPTRKRPPTATHANASDEDTSPTAVPKHKLPRLWLGARRVVQSVAEFRADARGSRFGACRSLPCACAATRVAW